jgi:ribonuclease P protein component
MPGSGFPRRLRLLRSVDFQRVFRRALRSGTREMVLLARPNDLGRPRLGLVVSRKCAASAVRRNRIKRLGRETFRILQHRLGSNDYILLGRRGLADLDNPTLRALLTWHLLKLARQCEPS